MKNGNPFDYTEMPNETIQASAGELIFIGSVRPATNIVLTSQVSPEPMRDAQMLELFLWTSLPAITYEKLSQFMAARWEAAEQARINAMMEKLQQSQMMQSPTERARRVAKIAGTERNPTNLEDEELDRITNAFLDEILGGEGETTQEKKTEDEPSNDETTGDQ